MQKVNGIYLPASDTHFPEMIRKSPLFAGKGTYQLQKLEAAMPHVRRKLVALDVGAHVGLWTRVLAHKFELVHAFEMVPEHADCLEMNIADLPSVTLHRDIAIGSGSGFAAILQESSNTGNTRIDPEPRPSNYSVPLRSLDSLFPDLTPNFIKIDVEGYEQQVVIGAAMLIKRSKPVIVIEQKGTNAERYGCRTGEVLDLLKSWGARIVWTRSGDHCLTWG